jgi:hypothetical protein
MAIGWPVHQGPIKNVGGADCTSGNIKAAAIASVANSTKATNPKFH